MTKSTLIAAGMACLALVLSEGWAQAEITGHYLESRTCQVYTGPCFANAEVGLAGKNAVMAWNIHAGEHKGVDLSGLNVVMALSTTETLGFQGIEGAGEVKAVMIVDERAKGLQRDALIDFARSHAGKAGQHVVRIDSAPIAMTLNELDLVGKLQAGKAVTLETRKARPTDCICSNESAYYPPLTEVAGFVPGVTSVGEFKGRGLGATWSTPDARSAYLARFAY